MLGAVHRLISTESITAAGIRAHTQIADLPRNDMWALWTKSGVSGNWRAQTGPFRCSFQKRRISATIEKNAVLQ